MLEISRYTCPGEHSPENQDAFEISAHPADSTCMLVAVADGQGGREGGAAAARLACSAGIEAAGAIPTAELLDPAAWARIIRAADEAVFREPAAGFTTLVVFGLTPNAVYGAANGDSALVLMQAEEESILTENQPKNPPVGSGKARLATFATRLAEPWTVLAMTDGVWKYTGWEPIFRIASAYAGPAIIEQLRDYARLSGCGRLQDDFTLIIAHNAG